MMKKILVLLLGLASVYNLSAQEKRKSPKVEVNQTIGEAKVAITYGQPSMKGRDIFGGLVPYGKVWRTGANEASVLEISAAMSIDGKEIPAGKYALFTIPGEESWTIILNSIHSQWGAYNYDESKDVLRVKTKSYSVDSTEAFKISISEEGKVELKWAETGVSFTLKGA